MSIQPKLIIHGGAGSLEGNIEKINHISTSLEDICNFISSSCTKVIKEGHIYYEKWQSILNRLL